MIRKIINPFLIFLGFKVAGGWKYGKAFFLYNFAPNLSLNLLHDGPNVSVGLQVHINDIIQSSKN